MDDNNNGVDNTFDPLSRGEFTYRPEDSNRDNTPDYKDLNSDTDDKSDNMEAYDLDDSGIADLLPLNTDIDGDGLDDSFDLVVLESSTWASNADNGGQTADSPFPNDDPNQGGGEPDWRDGGVLPVEWIGFTAEWEEQKGLLAWDIGVEVNTDKFSVERKIGIEGIFLPIGELAASGNSQETTSYRFVDETANQAAQSDVLYYRIKQIDLNGFFDYSEIEELSLIDQQQEIIVNVYPNPAIDELFLDLNMIKEGQVKIQVMTIGGRQVYTQTIESRDNPLYRIPVRRWSPGRYIVVIENERLRISKKMMVK